MQNITIIGAGHGGVALAAYFSGLGNKVTLSADKNHMGFIKNIYNNNSNILVNNLANKNNVDNKPFEKTNHIYCITTDYKQALDNSEIIYIVTPSFAHEQIFKNIMPYINNNHKIITIAGNFATIVFNNLLQKSNIHKPCLLADISSLPYACRVDQTGYTVNILGIKDQMGIATIPANLANKLIDTIQPHFPTKLIAYKNPLEIGLNITSGISHPITALFNAGRIGNDKSPFYFYKEGISEHTSILLEKLDQDRIHIGKLYNLNLPRYTNLMHEFYGDKYETIYDFFRGTKTHNKNMLCPKSLSERYISQDIPYVIVPWYTLGKLMNFESQIMRNIIELSSMINNIDYIEHGINEEKLTSIYSSVRNFVSSIERGCMQCFPTVA